MHDAYDQQIDVWSLGCILAELLLMEKRYCSVLAPDCGGETLKSCCGGIVRAASEPEPGNEFRSPRMQRRTKRTEAGRRARRPEIDT